MFDASRVEYRKVAVRHTHLFEGEASARQDELADDPLLDLRARRVVESINRHLDDTLWLRRACSIGNRRQRLDMITYALGVNVSQIVTLDKRRLGERVGALDHDTLAQIDAGIRLVLDLVA